MSSYSIYSTKQMKVSVESDGFFYNLRATNKIKRTVLRKVDDVFAQSSIEDLYLSKTSKRSKQEWDQSSSVLFLYLTGLMADATDVLGKNTEVGCTCHSSHHTWITHPFPAPMCTCPPAGMPDFCVKYLLGCMQACYISCHKHPSHS